MFPAHHRPAHSGGHILPVAASQRQESRPGGGRLSRAQQGPQRHTGGPVRAAADSLRREAAAMAEGAEEF